MERMRDDLHEGFASVELFSDEPLPKPKTELLLAQLEKYFEAACGTATDDGSRDGGNGAQEMYPRTQIGYQVNMCVDFEPLLPFLRFALNNVGDPYVESAYSLNTRAVERPVLEFFFRVLHNTDPTGYVTSGGTEGNLYGLFLARELYPNAHVFFSDQTHYSIRKIVHMLRMESTIVPSLADGQIDSGALIDAILGRPHAVPVVVANVGSTFLGAYDDVQGIFRRLDDAEITRRYVHVDAALGGLFLPFVEGAPPFDFRLPIDSMSVSGHKALGAPFPCGVFVARRLAAIDIGGRIEELGTRDTTLVGSRNGLAALVLWWQLARRGESGLRAMVKEMLKNARYAERRLREEGLRVQRFRPFGFCIVIDSAPADVAARWSLSNQSGKSHFYVMEHVTKSVLEEFIADLKRARRSAEQQ